MDVTKIINDAVKELQTNIPNLYDYYSLEDVVEILNEYQLKEFNDVTESFMEHVWERPIRRCSHCGKLMDEGYILEDDYACSDQCRNEIYKTNAKVSTDEEAELLYLLDCYDLSLDEVEGLTNEMIMKLYRDREPSDSAFYTEWR